MVSKIRKKRALSKAYNSKRYEVERDLLKKRYNENRELKKRQALERYYSKKQQSLKKKALQRYYIKQNSLKKKALDRYYTKQQSLQKLAVQRYHRNRLPLKSQSLKRYYANRMSKRADQLRYYMNNHQLLKAKALHRYYKSNHVNAEFRKTCQGSEVPMKHDAQQMKEISKGCSDVDPKVMKEGGVLKRRVIRPCKNPLLIMRFSYPRNLKKLVSKLTGCGTLSERVLQAELLLKWVYEYRKIQVNKITSSLRNWKNISRRIVIRMQPFKAGNQLTDMTQILGKSEHTPSTEPFYLDGVYKPVPCNATCITDVRDSSAMKWVCDPEVCDINTQYCVERLEKICTLIGKSSLQNFPSVMNSMDLCNSGARDPQKTGHPESCHISQCPSILLFLRKLAPHFPSVRQILNYLYSAKKGYDGINVIDKALFTSNLKTLESIAAKMRSSGGKEYTIGTNHIKCEDDIIQKYKESFKKLVSKCNDTPVHPCMSCEKLCFRTQVHFVKNLRSQPTCEAWNNLQIFCSDNNLPADSICSTCLQKFRSGNMPSTCLMNNLFVRPVPPQIQQLNQFEKILIQRAKCFQVVVKMGTVSKRKQPATNTLVKSIGRAFHLPLPTEQTLKTIPLPDQPLPDDLGLHILVRGVPTNKKKIWQSVVDVKKVHSALLWLKDNNPLYSSINIPSIEEFNNQINGQNHVFHDDDADESTEVEETSLLTKMSADDSFYDSYTVCDLNESRPNKTATEIYQMRKTDAPPLRSFEDKDIDIKCFPDLYPYGDNGLHAEREIPITPSEFAKLRIMSRHSQFRSNHQYIFYLMHEQNIRALQAGIYHKQNVIHNHGKLSAAGCMAAIEKGDLEQDLAVTFSRLRNSSAFWNTPRSDIETMIQYYGPVTFFLTISPSEFLWDDLNEFLSTVNGIEPGKKSTSALIAMDPVSTSRFIDQKFKAMMDFITSDENPLGEVSHYAFRREYQTRGLQHFHIVLWVRNAPVIGDSSPDEVAHFINSHITCSLPSKQLFPTIHRRVTQHQKHHHNDYCMRRKKTKSGVRSVCRFGFPRKVSESFVLNGVAESIVGRRQLKSSRLYDLTRTDSEQDINDYNPAIMLAWEGNCDIQFIGENSRALSRYVTKYQTKCEKSNDSGFIQGNCQSLTSVLWNIGMREISSRECGILEACDAILGIPLFGTDPGTVLRWVDVNMIRKRRIKPKKELARCDPLSTDIYFPSLVDTHYPARPLEMEGTSLFEYASNYDVVKKKPVSENAVCYEYPPYGYVKRRSTPCLIKHAIFNINNQPEKYFFSMLLLFKPWRDISDLRNGFPTYAEAFQDNLQMVNFEMERHHNNLQQLRHSKEVIDAAVTRLTAAEPTTNNSSTGKMEVDDHQIHIMDGITSSDLDRIVNQLNEDQTRVFNHVVEAVSDPTHAPIRHFVSGVGGTGKSYLIKALTGHIELRLNKKVAVAAPTGVAAFNIGGVTLHRLLRLPVEHSRKTPEYHPLNDDVLKMVRESFKDVILLIIDEVSMVSNVSLLFIHLRLTEVFNSQNVQGGWFGNLHILTFGDLLQLPPVLEHPPYHDIEKSTLDKSIKGMGNINLWKKLFTYDELTINVRQQNDTDFAGILSRIRVGIPNDDDITILSKRIIKLKGKTTDERAVDLAKHVFKSSPSLAILPLKEMCSKLNSAVLSTLDSQAIHLKAIDSVDCNEKLKNSTLKKLNEYNKDPSKTAGLDHVITIKIGCQVMIVRNLDVTLGLVNGTIGTIEAVSYDSDNSIKELKINIGGKSHSIERVMSKFEVVTGGYVHRSQFPVTLAYAITVHKSQGMTVENCFVDIGNHGFASGQSYVALSRVTSLDGVRLINFDPSRIKANMSAIMEYNRLREIFRPHLPLIPTTERRLCKVNDIVWCKVEKQSEKVQDNPSVSSGSNTSPPAILIPGFQNADSVSCYSNASLQVLFHSSVLLGEILIEASGPSSRAQRIPGLLELAQLYASQQCAPLNTKTLRIQVGEPFNLCEQQDAMHFFERLASNSHPIENCFKIVFFEKVECTHCNYFNSQYSSDVALRLSIPRTNRRQSTLTLKDLITANYSSVEYLPDTVCNQCNHKGTYKKTVDIHNTSDLVMVQLNLWDGFHMQKNSQFRLNSLPTSKLRISNSHYKMASAIFHHGASVNEGHYTAMLREGDSSKFLRADDSMIRPEKWPRGAKDIYMIALTRTK